MNANQNIREIVNPDADEHDSTFAVHTYRRNLNHAQYIPKHYHENRHQEIVAHVKPDTPDKP